MGSDTPGAGQTPEALPKSARKMPTYSPASLCEQKNIDTLRNIFAKHEIKSDLKTDDKIPSLDGHIELLDENKAPLWEISVQIRPLSEKDLSDPKAQIELTLFDLAETRTNPIIFIAVNSEKRIAYWKRIDKDEISSVPSTQQSKVFHFDPKNQISDQDVSYIDAWKKICVEQSTKINKFDDVVRENQLKGKMIEDLQTNGISDRRPEYVKIHRFLDHFNDLYANRFVALKNFLYSDCWKFGFVYSDYRLENVSFSCFPIRYDSNQKQIIKILPALVNRFLNEGLTFHGRENWVESENYQRLSVDLIRHDATKCVERKLFDIPNEIQASEILFCLIKDIGPCLGLVEKDEYSFQEIYNGWFRYLPVWIDEVLRSEKVVIGHNGSINPHFLLMQIVTDERRAEIDNRVRERIKNGDLETQPFVITHNSLVLRQVVKSIFYMENNHIPTIRRVYPKPVWPKTSKSSYVWDGYPKEILKEKLTTIYTNLEKTYDELVKIHFPQIYSDLRFLRDFDRIIIHVQLEARTSIGSPQYTTYYLKRESGDENENYFELYFDSEFPYKKEDFEFRSDDTPTIISIRESKFRLISYSKGGNDFVYSETPLVEICYREIKEALKTYFDKIAVE